jgi:hypothetical protein
VGRVGTEIRGSAIRKRLIVVLVAAVVAGLIPVAATAKPKPPEPEPSWSDCVFVDGTLQEYTGGNYNCMWQAGAGSHWAISVTPEGAAVSITLAVKDNQTSAGGDLCPVSSTDPPADRNPEWLPSWSRDTEPVTATYDLPGGSGNCVDLILNDIDPGDADEFTLFVDTLPGRNRVSVTVDTVPPPP